MRVRMTVSLAVLCALVLVSLQTTCAVNIKPEELVVHHHDFYEEDDYYDDSHYEDHNFKDVVTGLPSVLEKESVKPQDSLNSAAVAETTTENVISSTLPAVSKVENSTLPEKKPLIQAATTQNPQKDETVIAIQGGGEQTKDDSIESSGSSEEEETLLGDDVIPQTQDIIPFDDYDQDYLLDDESIEVHDQNDQKEEEEEGNNMIIMISSDEETKEPNNIFVNPDNESQEPQPFDLSNDGLPKDNNGDDDEDNNNRKFISPRFSFLPNWRDRIFSGVFIGFCALTFATILFMFYRGLVWYNQRSKTTTIMYQRMEEGGGDPTFHQ